MLHHIGIGVNSAEEIKDFYQDILGFQLKYDFPIPAELAEKIFAINENIHAYFVSKDGLALELFVSRHESGKKYDHVCLSVENRDVIIQKAKDKNYECIVIQRENSNLVFIKDKSGNLFEIKE